MFKTTLAGEKVRYTNVTFQVGKYNSTVPENFAVDVSQNFSLSSKAFHEKRVSQPRQEE